MDPGVSINHALIQSDCWDKGDFIFKLVTAVTTQVVKTCKQIAGVTVIFMGRATFFLFCLHTKSGKWTAKGITH